ncbi:MULTISPECIES: UDP-N-acetylmuramoyl-tripeptide--D-alanyl-D-alanine ligase [unclassified Paenibacillus]|uniref:UDP-N-acetylmuramoyl-tripeptide--D-alanyl-D- alanine ligase n=1 Tax=unclassified Paenibacillus TaxID=185978 RepID=UPI001AE96E20|nr:MULTISPECIES: UDP-N-acetylmuramoyl-tripeptide--D-alanyl-D-alanine ligase [unclassified Paenibacillus]MBP1154188.1 UDP-N-acetylmuramoyl-tripeptide--D-alanyl-D-alanine ligase [Paenibacillus sp. PvP091]MBP1170427.1 UDP-N-acetylmuramoyl-tripeptide--D-alanyl-D-alanine ligase [Paenibacillus sp. PvR098]MBP2441455.1 UDP-N-acetylmuramoyl-tripeptide--D-alanyl-D-alanine ligase [Paenibacillus sp. PvP052]
MFELLLTFASLFWLGHAVLRLLNGVHMLQLNSYRNERFMGWFKGHVRERLSWREWLPLLSFAALLFQAPLPGFILWTVIYGLLVWLRPKKQEKKKLVYTARVKRLLVTLGVLVAAALAVSLMFAAATDSLGPFILLFAIVLLSDLVVLLANTINLPIENRINRYYLNDAERIVRQMKQLTVIGITGSYGKTSVKHFLNTLLSQVHEVLVTPESYNTPMGVTKTVRSMLRPTHRFFITEMGAKQTGDIRELCELVGPKIGILTAVGPQHLETFKTLENVQRTKFELGESLPPDGILFLNMDDENIASYRGNIAARKVGIGIYREDVAYRARNIQYTSKGASFELVRQDGSILTFETGLLGEHNIYNLLLSIAVSLELGVPAEKLALLVKRIKPVKHRLELKKISDKVTILDDSFNSNPVGSKAALDVLAQMPGKRIMITPGMIELGEKEYELNRQFGVHAAGACDYIILVGHKQTKPIQDGLRDAGYPEDRLYIAKDLQEALRQMNVAAEQGSVVLLENDLPDNYNE